MIHIVDPPGTGRGAGAAAATLRLRKQHGLPLAQPPYVTLLRGSKRAPPHNLWLQQAEAQAAEVFGAAV